MHRCWLSTGSPDQPEEKAVRRLIGTIGVTLAAVAVMAASAAAANAQGLIEYGLMSGFVAPANGDPEIETFGPAHRVGSGPGLESERNAGEPADPSSAFVYRRGRYIPLDATDGLPTAHNGFNNRGQIVGAYIVDLAAPTIRGFLRGKRGDYKRIDVPGAAVTPSIRHQRPRHARRRLQPRPGGPA
jgi:hypothetical protein